MIINIRKIALPLKVALCALVVVYAFKFSYSVHSQRDAQRCNPDGAVSSYTLYHDKTSHTVDFTFPASYVWPGRATNPRWPLTTIIGVDIDFDTLKPYCTRRAEWISSQREKGKMFSGWDQRFLGLAIKVDSQPNDNTSQYDNQYNIPTGTDQYGFSTYIKPLDPEYRYKYGYQVMHEIPAGALNDTKTYIMCKIVASSRVEKVQEWAGKPNVCYFLIDHDGTVTKVRLQYEQMENLPLVKQKAIAFIDKYKVKTIKDKAWHFLTMW